MREFAPYCWEDHPSFYLGPCAHWRRKTWVLSEPEGILVVDDDVDDLFFLERAMTRAGVSSQTTFIRDGGEAIEYLAHATSFGEHPVPKLVLLDLAMPTVTGLQVLEWISGQSRLSKVSVVVFTSVEDPRQISRAFALGAKRCYRKTPDVYEWVNLVSKLANEFELLSPTAVLAPSCHQTLQAA